MSILSFNGHFFEITNERLNRDLISRIQASDFSYDEHRDTFTCQSVKEAFKFLEIADEKATKLFKRLIRDWYPLPENLGLELFEMGKEQAKGIKHILTRSSCYIADEPGFGKTAQVIIAAAIASREKKLEQVLFIVPPQLTLTWKKEIEKFWPYEKLPTIEILKTQKKEFDWLSDILILPDSMLDKESNIRALYKRKFALVGVDEAHRFKEEKSIRTVMLFGGFARSDKYSPGLIYGARHKVLMSGTPLLNRPIELWAALYSTAPEVIDFMSKHEYGLEYCAAFQDRFWNWNYKGSSNEDKLKRKLFKDYMIRRKLSDQPALRRRVVYVNKDLRSSEVKKFELDTVQKFTMREIAEMSEGQYLSTYRRETGLAKVDFIAAYTQLRLEDGEDVLLFLHHREVIEAVADKLAAYSPVVAYGATKQKDKQTIESRYNERGGLFIGNIDTAGFGFTLTKANRVILGEFSWTQKINEQVEKRAARRGQTRNVNADYIVFENSFDEKQFEVMYTKENKIRKVID